MRIPAVGNGYAGTTSQQHVGRRPISARTPRSEPTTHSLWPPQRVCAGGHAMFTHAYTHTKYTAITHSSLLVCAPAGAGQTLQTGGVAGRACLNAKTEARARAPRLGKLPPAATLCLAAAAPGGVRSCCADLNFFLMLANRSSRPPVHASPHQELKCGVPRLDHSRHDVPIAARMRTHSQRRDTRERQLVEGAAGLLERARAITHELQVLADVEVRSQLTTLT
jgi:hypothetical protein